MHSECETCETCLHCHLCTKDELEDARFVARALWDFIQEGCFLDDIEMGEPDTPEWELWVKKHVVQDLVYDNPWVKEQE